MRLLWPVGFAGLASSLLATSASSPRQRTAVSKEKIIFKRMQTALRQKQGRVKKKENQFQDCLCASETSKTCNGQRKAMAQGEGQPQATTGWAGGSSCSFVPGHARGPKHRRMPRLPSLRLCSVRGEDYSSHQGACPVWYQLPPWASMTTLAGKSRTSSAATASGPSSG